MKKKMRGLLVAGMLSVALVLGGCSESDAVESASEGTEVVEEEMTEEEAETVEGTETVEEAEAEPETGEKAEEEEAASEEAADEPVELDGAGNMEDAPKLTLGAKVIGTLANTGSGDIKWYYFTTDTTEDTVYEIAVGKDSSDITVSVFDEHSNELLSQKTESGGLTTYITLDDLEPDTKYYIRLSIGSYQSKEYSLSVYATDIVSTSEDSSEKTGNLVKTAETETDLDVETEDGSTEIRFGTNQNDAVLIPLKAKVYATIDNDYCWCSFTTGSNTNADYQMTIIDKSTEYNVYAYIYDEYGTEITYGEASKTGLASTFSCGDLSANTTYYICFDAHYAVGWNTYYGDPSFVVIIRDFNDESSAVKTSDSAHFSLDTDIIIPATNQDDAEFVSLNTKYERTIEGDYNYFAFTTTTEGEYIMVLVDESTEYAVYAHIYDEYGTEITSSSAETTGRASTISLEDFSANTTYYICFDAHYNVGWNTYFGDPTFTFTINEPETAEVQTATIEEEEEDLIFSTPYEINSTQVQFVANKAEFIDEEAAKAAVEPVAEALLAYPEHSILIAGTTATAGSQDSCVELSRRRAEAVKNLLVEEFGVPESQIETIGLGYEADPFERGQDREIAGDLTSKFIESEAKKNRRVVIMDIDSEIAQEILASAD